jgi:hypothetical protein
MLAQQDRTIAVAVAAAFVDVERGADAVEVAGSRHRGRVHRETPSGGRSGIDLAEGSITPKPRAGKKT